MSTCPNCTQRIGLKALVSSVLPVWITCASCQTRLVGSRLVLLVALVQSLLIGGLFVVLNLSYTFAVFFTNELYEIPRAAVRVVTLSGIATFAVAFLIIWPAGICLVWRRGAFVNAADGRREIGGFRNYLLATGVVSAIVVTWSIIYADYSPTMLVLLISWAFFPFLVLYRCYDFRLGNRIGCAWLLVLLLWAAIANMSAVVLAVYSIANYPKEPPFEERLTLSLGTQDQHEAWARLVDLVGTKKYDSPTKLNMDNEQDREVLLDFLSQNVMSPPEEALTIDAAVPRISSLFRLQEVELVTISDLLAQGDHSAASVRHLRLWNAAHNLVSGSPITLIQYLIGVDYIRSLADFYLEGNNRWRLSGSDEVIKLVIALPAKLDDAEANAFISEYFVLRNFFLPKEETCRALERERLFCPSNVPWPFYDPYKTLREHHEKLSRTVDLSRAPHYAVEREITASEADLDETVSGKFPGTKDSAKAKLAVVGFAIESLLSGDFQKVPIDPFTGQPFLVTDKGDTVEVRSASKKADGEPEIRYELQKQVR